ncbi:MAG TPA: hypothetical protein EYN66_03805 [Myxococcales bacterium]|nr:hypothetical protein [Myxococcales bacterium]
MVLEFRYLHWMKWVHRLSIVALCGYLTVGCSELPFEHQDSAQNERVLSRVQGRAETPTIQCLSPQNLVTIEATGAATAVTVTFQTNMAAELEAESVTLVYSDNGQSVGSQQDTSPVIYNLPFGEHVLSLGFVADGQPVFGENTFCKVQVRITHPCLSGDDCKDDFLCNTTDCVAVGGGEKLCKFGPAQYDGCCENNVQCPNGQYCDIGKKVCTSCTLDGQCDDANACTVDSCLNGACVSVKTDPECCDCNAAFPLGQCNDGLFCTVDACDCDGGACSHEPKQLNQGVCCESGDNESCDDGDKCTLDACVGNICRHSKSLLVECCVDDGDCSDGNACTNDACDVESGTCSHEPVGNVGCCNSSEECDDLNATTLDACINFECVYTENLDYCVPPTTSVIVINELMINPSTAGDSDGEWIELFNSTDVDVDVSTWILSDLGGSGVVVSADAPLIVPGGGYLVLCRNADPLINGNVNCDFEYGGEFELANQDDQIILKDGTGEIHDQVYYDGGPNFPNPSGASIALVNPIEDNNVGARWKTSLMVIPGSGDLGTPGAENSDVFKVFEVSKCHEQPQDDVCTTDTCIDSTCTHLPVEGCCNTVLDCVLPSACHLAQCNANKCTYTVMPPPGCCITHEVCDDSIPCTIDRCLGHTCRHGPDPDLLGKSCCNSNADCGGLQNECITSTCDVPTHTCTTPEFVGGFGCCDENSYPSTSIECSDGDPASMDTCKDFKCLSFADPTYCDAQPGNPGTNNCVLDSDPCTDLSCDLSVNKCLFNEVVGCCHENADCDDGNPCTVGECSAGTNSCIFSPIAGCCLASQAAIHCNDSNPCTVDECVNLIAVGGGSSQSAGICRNTKEDLSCCNENGECEDGNTCTVGSCNLITHSCSFVSVTTDPFLKCCDPDNAILSVDVQCDDGNLCTVDSCLNGLCIYNEVPANQFGNCCDVDNEAGLSDAQLCNDGQSCTLDKCMFGRCRHIADAAEDCCKVDADCNDANACTVDSCNTNGQFAECVNVPKVCDDGLFCNGVEVCNIALGCTADASTLPNLDDGVLCTQDLCDETLKMVVHTPVHSDCADGVFCNGEEICDSQFGCTAGSVPNGDDGNTCTDDVCNEALNIFIHTPNNGVCNDGKTCNGLESCSAELGCIPGSGIQQDDGVACTVDSCDDATNTAYNQAVDALCDDGVFCTVEYCDPLAGCKNSLTPGYCQIGGACYLTNAVNPANDCQICDPGKSTSQWSSKSLSTEVCNGLDDDCDGLVDTDSEGDPLLKTCQNACGQAGIKICVAGTFTECTAPKADEICGDGMDNDCDGETDEDPCESIKPGVAEAELRFISSLGEVENLISGIGAGQYSTGLQNLSYPNATGSVSADAYGVKSPWKSFSVVALPVATVEVVVMREQLYVDQATTEIVVQARDLFERPVAIGTVVSIELTGLGLPQAVNLNCNTDLYGRCGVNWTAPSGVFSVGGIVLISVTSGGLLPVFSDINIQPAPTTLNLVKPGVGLQLPVSPIFPNSYFKVPVYLHTGGTQAGGYDIHLTFDKDKVAVTAVSGGNCTAFETPLSNLAAVGANNANQTGKLTFNQINAKLTEPCATGHKVEVAVVTFKVLDGLTPDDPAAAANIFCLVKDLITSNFAVLAANEPCVVADGGGITSVGEVTAWANTVKGILTYAPYSQVLNWKPVTGMNSELQLQVMAYHRNFQQEIVTYKEETIYQSSNELVGTTTATGKLVPAAQAGVTIVTAQYQNLASTARVRVLQPETLELKISDTELQPITGSNAGGGAAKFQKSKLIAELGWTDGTKTLWIQDVTNEFTSDKFSTPSGLNYSVITREFAGTQAGNYTVSVKGPNGLPLASTSIAISPSAPVGCASLTVVAPCTVKMESIDPSEPSAQIAFAKATAGVYAYLTKYQQQCSAQVYANFVDGTRNNITGTAGVEFESLDSNIVTSSLNGLLIAQSAGETQIKATWIAGGQSLCAGQSPIKVDLPKPTYIEVAPPSAKIAINAGDGSAILKGLPIHQKLNVLIHYEDGSFIDFSNHASTKFDADTADPANIIVVTNTGLVSATGTAPGQSKVFATVGLYPALSPGQANITVVKASGLAAEVYEPYTPVPPAVSDHVFSLIEGSSVWQDGVFEVKMQFSDGTTVDVTDHLNTQVEVKKPGTSQSEPGVVSLDKVTRKVTPLGVGSADIWFINGALVAQIQGFQVNNANESAALLFPAAYSGPTFSGIKDVGTTSVQVWVLFNDGTRRRLWGNRFIEGLLKFDSTVVDAATIDSQGTATIHQNKSTVFTVDIAAGQDAGTSYDPAAEYAVDCNLLPGCGDVDMGDSIGLAFKDQMPGAQFSMEVRLNTCDKAMGAFDFELTYDKQVLEAVDALAHGATVGVTFNANPYSKPGTIYMNAAFNPQAGAKKGSNLPVAKVHFKALKGGDGISEMGGIAQTVVALDAITPIGPPTPRYFVAAIGELDPQCSVAPLLGDVNGDCVVSRSDLLRLMELLNGAKSSVDERRRADIDNDGRLTVKDLLYDNQLID